MFTLTLSCDERMYLDNLSDLGRYWTGEKEHPAGMCAYALLVTRYYRGIDR